LDFSLATALGYLAICIIWGTTFLAIKVGLEGFAPFFMAGTRFLIAGLLLSPVLLRKSARMPKNGRELGAIILSGALLLLGGNGIVTLAEVYLDSGLTALTIATNPAWTALIGGWFFARKDERYERWAVLGTVISLVGVLVLHHKRLNLHHAELPGVLFACAAPLFWSTGSLIARTRIKHADVLSATAIQMLSASFLILFVSRMLGESWHVTLSPRVISAVLYLIVIGSIVAYAVYVWLLKHMPASRLMTYTYINPIIALVVGSLILHEPIGIEVYLATVLVLGGLLIIYFAQQRNLRLSAATTPRAQAS
jgi:drug/metabolite transporter (DMT)-like permease